jgi:hypothetical protein
MLAELTFAYTKEGVGGANWLKLYHGEGAKSTHFIKNH